DLADGDVLVPVVLRRRRGEDAGRLGRRRGVLVLGVLGVRLVVGGEGRQGGDQGQQAEQAQSAMHGDVLTGRGRVARTFDAAGGRTVPPGPSRQRHVLDGERHLDGDRADG